MYYNGKYSIFLLDPVHRFKNEFNPFTEIMLNSNYYLMPTSIFIAVLEVNFELG